MIYKYSAKIESSGRVVRAQTNADNVEKAYELLERRGLTNIKIDSKLRKDINLRDLITNKLRLSDISYIMRNLTVSLQAGLPLSKALTMLISLNPDSLKQKRLTELLTAVSDGDSLSTAMSKRENEYGALTCALIAAGEESGNLETGLEQSADIIDFNIDVRRQITSALSYPVTILVLALLVLFAVITFVLPNLLSNFKDLGADPPAITTAILSLSSFLSKAVWFPIGKSGLGLPILPLLFIAAVYGVFRVLQIKHVRFQWDKWKLKLPVFGVIFHDIAMSRIATTISVLLEAGIAMPRVLRLAAKTTGNSYLENELGEAVASVLDGASLSESLNPDIFAPLLIQLIAAGEVSGNIPNLLARYLETLDKDIQAKVARVETKIQPIAIVLIGIVVGVLVFAVYSPLYSYVDKI